jgi:hypothetical protein
MRDPHSDPSLSQPPPPPPGSPDPGEQMEFMDAPPSPERPPSPLLRRSSRLPKPSKKVMDYTPGAKHVTPDIAAELYLNFLCNEGAREQGLTPVSTRPPTPEPAPDVPDRRPNDPYVTRMSSFGMIREYLGRPTYTPQYKHILRFCTANDDDATIKRSVANIIKPHDDISQWYFNYGLIAWRRLD